MYAEWAVSTLGIHKIISLNMCEAHRATKCTQYKQNMYIFTSSTLFLRHEEYVVCHKDTRRHETSVQAGLTIYRTYLDSGKPVNPVMHQNYR